MKNPAGLKEYASTLTHVLMRFAYMLMSLSIVSHPALAQEDAYHPKSIPWIDSRDVCDAKMPRHVETMGTVDYVHKEKDGDIHVRVCSPRDDGLSGSVCIVAEIIPQLPITKPRKGQMVTVKGIAGYDYEHGWWELNPVTEMKEMGQ